MSSPTEIVNNALGHLGAAPLAELDTDITKIGKLARRLWQSTADECVADHVWNYFRVRTGALTADATAPTWGDWTTRFPLPPDPYCLRVIGTDGDDTKEPWTVEGRFILTQTSAVQILYLRRSTDTGEWPPLFVTAMEYRMASKLAYAVTRSLSVQQDMLKMYFAELARARSMNAHEGGIRTSRSTTLIDVRRE